MRRKCNTEAKNAGCIGLNHPTSPLHAFFLAVIILIKNLYSLWQAAITGYCAVNQFAVVQTFFTVYVFNIQCWSQNTGISKASSRCAEGEEGKEGGRGGGEGRMFTLACRWQENSLLFEGTKCDAEIVLHFNLIRFFSPSLSPALSFPLSLSLLPHQLEAEHLPCL